MLRIAMVIHCNREAWFSNVDNIAMIVRPA